MSLSIVLTLAFDCCVFQELDFCVVTLPTLSAEVPLLQSFLRVPPRANKLPLHELYIFQAAGLRWVRWQGGKGSS